MENYEFIWLFTWDPPDDRRVTLEEAQIYMMAGGSGQLFFETKETDFRDALLHRTDGPARISLETGSGGYFLFGEYFSSKEEWEKSIKEWKNGRRT